jgi:hypothetical protein
MAVMKELFGAYARNELPTDGGYIVSTFFDETSTYTKYEVTSYNNVKDIFNSEDGLTFQADGQKIFVLVEPASYSKKHVEPTHRSDMERIPYRFKEVDTYTTRRQDRIIVGKEPVMTYGSFTILKTQGNNFSYIFFMSDDLMKAIEEFFAKSLREDARVPRGDAQKASSLIAERFDQIVIKPH